MSAGPDPSRSLPSVGRRAVTGRGSNWLDFDATPVPVHLGAALGLISALRPDIIQLPLTLVDQPAGRSGVPVVVVAENPALERLRYAITTVASRRCHGWRWVPVDSTWPSGTLSGTTGGRLQRMGGLATFRPQASRHLTAPLLFFNSRLRDKPRGRGARARSGSCPARPPKREHHGIHHPSLRDGVGRSRKARVANNMIGRHAIVWPANAPMF